MVRARKGPRGRVIAVMAGATLVATTMGAGATYASAFAPSAASLAALGSSCATDQRLRGFPGSRAAARMMQHRVRRAPQAPTGARAARMMAAAGGKGGKQRNGGGKRRDDAGDDKPDADRLYEYVSGGFAEKMMPSFAEDREKSSMYEAFDSALRASSYNMFCSPLKSVNTPAAFKAEMTGDTGDTLKFSGEEIQEDPEEVRRRAQEQYALLDRLISDDQRATSNGNSRLKKMQRKTGKLNQQSAPPTTREEGARDAGTVPRGVLGLERQSQPMQKNAKGKATSKGVSMDLAAQLEGLAGNNRAESSSFSDIAFEAYPSTEASEVEEGYEELQRLLGHKPMGGQKRKVDSARFTGDMDKYREAGMFKRVTLKDPLSRIYAQRLRSVPAPVNEGVIARPRRQEEAAHLAEAGKGNKGSAAKAEQQAVDQFIDDVITSMGNAQPPKPELRAAPPKPPGQGSGAKPRKRRAAGAEVGTGAGAAAGPEMPAMGGRGRVVLNHSTHIPGLIDVLHRLVETEGIFTVVPGPLSRANSNSQQLVLRLSSPTDQGFKLIARKGTQTQEVFVVSDLEAETLEAAIAWAL